MRREAGSQKREKQKTALPLIAVACGVLVNAAGEILIAQRPPGKIAAGKWEFPGGKIESGEDTPTALARELDEELGVRIRAAEPLAQLQQDYHDRSVWLDTWRVTTFDGEPQPREGQQLAWIAPETAGRYDLLPSCWRVLAALRLPRHYVFTPPTAPLDDWLPHLQQLPSNALLRLRRPQLGGGAYEAEARRLAEACREHDLGLILDREPAQVEALNVAGWHATTSALAQLSRRPLPRSLWCLASAHTAQELSHAREVDMDAAVLAPVRPTPTHPGASVLGWDGFSALAGSAGLPTYALGGLGPDDLMQARTRGALGVAGISAYWAAY